jgi:hypothetical protein
MEKNPNDAPIALARTKTYDEASYPFDKETSTYCCADSNICL